MPQKKEGRSCANSRDQKSVIEQPRDYLTTFELSACALSAVFFAVEAIGWAVRNGII